MPITCKGFELGFSTVTCSKHPRVGADVLFTRMAPSSAIFLDTKTITPARACSLGGTQLLNMWYRLRRSFSQVWCTCVV